LYLLDDEEDDGLDAMDKFIAKSDRVLDDNAYQF